MIHSRYEFVVEGEFVVGGRFVVRGNFVVTKLSQHQSNLVCIPACASRYPIFDLLSNPHCIARAAMASVPAAAGASTQVRVESNEEGTRSKEEGEGMRNVSLSHRGNQVKVE